MDNLPNKKFSIEAALPELIAIGLLAWALLPFNPYGYYIFLRLAICGIAIYLALKANASKMQGWMFAFAGIALLYNPLIRVHLDRETWSIINVLTITILALFSWQNHKRNER